MVSNNKKQTHFHVSACVRVRVRWSATESLLSLRRDNRESGSHRMPTCRWRWEAWCSSCAPSHHSLRFTGITTDTRCLYVCVCMLWSATETLLSLWPDNRVRIWEPQNAYTSLMPGSTVFITCAFLSFIKVHWFHNGHPLSVCVCVHALICHWNSPLIATR